MFVCLFFTILVFKLYIDFFMLILVLKERNRRVGIWHLKMNLKLLLYHTWWSLMMYLMFSHSTCALFFNVESFTFPRCSSGTQLLNAAILVGHQRPGRHMVSKVQRSEVRLCRQAAVHFGSTSLSTCPLSCCFSVFKGAAAAPLTLVLPCTVQTKVYQRVIVRLLKPTFFFEWVTF